jgi:hypothetical protein
MDVSTNKLNNLNLWLKTSGFDHESNELERILKESLDGSGLGTPRGTNYHIPSQQSVSTGLDWLQAGLGAIGLVPAAGEFFDLANVAISTLRKDPVNAILNAVSMITTVGDIFGKGTQALLKAIKSGTMKNIELFSKVYTVGSLGAFLQDQLTPDVEQKIRTVLNKMDEVVGDTAGTMYATYTTHVKGVISNAAKEHRGESSLRHDGQYESVA